MRPGTLQLSIRALAGLFAVAGACGVSQPGSAQTKTAMPADKKPAASESRSSTYPPCTVGSTGEVAARRGKGQAHYIALRVNDDAVTANEIDVRAGLLSLGSAGMAERIKARAEQRWSELTKDPAINKQFQELLKARNVQTKEEAQALQKEFVQGKQKQMVDQIKRDEQAKVRQGSRKIAIEELIDERLKLQEAARLSVVATDEDVEGLVKGIADRNKMTIEQFTQHLKNVGTDISTMRSRYKATVSWRDVIRRRFGHQIAITDRDVDRLISTTAIEGEDEVELKLHRIIIAMPAKFEQKAAVERMANADAARRKFGGCTTTASLAGSIPGARFEDLGSRKANSIPQPTRSLLLSAADGDMVPAVIGDGGIELWAVCSRSVVKADEQKREAAQSELRAREFEIHAANHLKTLRRDASICTGAPQ